ncbi:Formylglycine-generating enzyme, required for sulfatase activity, contains SUMF1/FGE domain [Abditibacterium utsteinense]|uniref:Formylglycine-generating enzyme, required for sulfatase activity, contains SUMF1/FGE domain n=2 Tax=Abditibacterium utsteinense TaxID=1960156 RepID=A0A2S8SS09_9BACT|nr:Formylglycine-generating enzyme, required for sulfatase activity, contains SUMF1/FGE domain [Abditibacterium utsteinense]
MGEDRPEIARASDGEGLVRVVSVAPFEMSATVVTVAQFAAFIEATGYCTSVEEFGWSYVFHRHLSVETRKHARGYSGEGTWWIGVDGASWKHPEGSGSHIKQRDDHPAVHVSWLDAQAFCAWSETRLPSEAEWEFAARGGLARKIFPWGDELLPKDKKGRAEHRMNVWQGKFPDLDTGADGFKNTAPARSFAPNDFGFYNMTGNVWQWCADWFRTGQTRAIRGGSFLCHSSYCNRYRCAARTGNTEDATSSHAGFRVAR